MARVSIVIPTRNAGPAFEDTLRAIAAQDLGEPYEVVVIDSGSTDGTPELARRHGARVMSIDPTEFGHGRTRNAAIATCAGEFVVLTVQDAVPADGRWLSALVGAMDEHPDAAGAYSRCLPRREAGFVERYLATREERTDVGDAPIVQRWPSEAHLSAMSPDDLRRCCAFHDGSSILRRAVWERCPLPHVRYAEDLAWSVAVMRRGHSVLYVPASRVRHSHHRSWWYELRRSYVDRRAVLELHAGVVPGGAGGGRPAIDSRRGVSQLIQDMTRAARDEGALTPAVWWAIQTRVLVGGVGVGLADLSARRRDGLWPPQIERWLARGI